MEKEALPEIVKGSGQRPPKPGLPRMAGRERCSQETLYLWQLGESQPGLKDPNKQLIMMPAL